MLLSYLLSQSYLSVKYLIRTREQIEPRMLFSQQLYQIFKLVAIIRVSICFLIKKIIFFRINAMRLLVLVLLVVAMSTVTMAKVGHRGRSQGRSNRRGGIYSSSWYQYWLGKSHLTCYIYFNHRRSIYN